MTNKRDGAGRVTYHTLHQALTDLGFQRRKTAKFTAYREADHGALIVLPTMDDNAEVGDPHLVAVRNTVALKGIASKARLDSLLAQSRHSGTSIKNNVNGWPYIGQSQYGDNNTNISHKYAKKGEKEVRNPR